MLTVYDYPTARALDTCDLDILFVGDSVAQNELGLDRPAELSLEMMLHHLKAVARGVESTHLMADLPYGSYKGPEDALVSALALVDAGANSVKLEGPRFDVVGHLTDAGIPVMGHVGLLPQTARRYVRQGTKPESAARIIDQAVGLVEAGCFAIVLEFMSDKTARSITSEVDVPTIGIGAGQACDGQVLVITDMLGQHENVPSFVRKYAHLFEVTVDAAKRYRDDVKMGHFPSAS